MQPWAKKPPSKFDPDQEKIAAAGTRRIHLDDNSKYRKWLISIS
jgi:hypothetical protein